MNDIDIVQVCAKDYKIMGGMVLEAFGLDNLVEITLKKMPDFVKSGFVTAQKVNSLEKRKQSEKIVDKYVQLARNGFLDKVPIINSFTLKSKLKEMSEKLFKMYSLECKINEDELEELSTILEEGMKEVEFVLSSMFVVFHGKAEIYKGIKDEYGSEVVKEFSEKFDAYKFKKSEYIAREIMFFGFYLIFMMEEEWEKNKKADLKVIDGKLDNLKSNLLKHFNKSKL